jgi:hypothetical protein
MQQQAKIALTSWKDIAAYLGKGIRTVQRWEDELGLPVRRPKQGLKSAVFAVPEEIDAWVKSIKFQDRDSLISSLRAEVQSLRHELALARSRISSLEVRKRL